MVHWVSVFVSAFQFGRSSVGESETRQSACCASGTGLAKSTLVPPSSKTRESTISIAAKQRSAAPETQAGRIASTLEKATVTRSSYQFQGLTFSSSTEKILQSALRDNTKKKYNVYWKQFQRLSLIHI